MQLTANFKETVEKWLEEASDDAFFGTIYVDIDWLIVLNDCFGHVHGDHAIEVVSERLRSMLQPTSHQFLRIGGDEFIVVVRGEKVTSLFELAEKMRAAVERLAIPLTDSDYRARYSRGPAQEIVTVSVGAMLMKCMNGTRGHGIGKWILDSARESVCFAKLAGRNKTVKIDLR